MAVLATSALWPRLLLAKRLLPGLSTEVNPAIALSIVRNTSNRPNGNRDERVVMNRNGSVIVCWHPEPKFPYEMTRPVPDAVPVRTDSKLNVQAVEDMKELYHHKPERLQRRDLMRLTWTTKHRWFPNNEWRYGAAKKTPKERPYL